jgi:hypothetical protein
MRPKADRHEILGLDQSPRLLVRPPDRALPWRRASIDVHGWAEPGTRITVNGTEVPVADDGLFLENIPLSSRGRSRSKPAARPPRNKRSVVSCLCPSRRTIDLLHKGAM